MSQTVFQATLTRLVIDPDFRDSLRTAFHDGGRTEEIAGANDLTEIEQKRLLAILGDKGLDATRTLHKSFRLTKLYSALPLTRRLVRPTRLAELVGSFWKASPPVSHYFIDEAIAFCDFLQNRVRSGLRIKYLEEIVAYERANLNLRRARADGQVPGPEVVRFSRDPMTLFQQLVEGKHPRAVPYRACTLIGSVDEEGEVNWRLSE